MAKSDTRTSAKPRPKTRAKTRAKGRHDARFEALPEIGGILHLEHVNFCVHDHDLATVFFMHGLGFTRDPFRRTNENNMGVNVGMQQFHLPRTGRTKPFSGEVGLLLPDLGAVKARLGKLRREGKFRGTPYAWKTEGQTARVVSPFGVVMRLHQAGSMNFPRPLGLPYVDVFVPPGKAEAIAASFRTLMNAPAAIRQVGGAKAAVVTMGPHQYARFREHRLKSYDYEKFHIAYYVSRYNEIRATLADAGALEGDASGQVFFFDSIIDPESGEKILGFHQEARSVYHPDFMRPLVNRWPIIEEPFSDQIGAVAAPVSMAGPSGRL